jgi:hypothetical protein
LENSQDGLAFYLVARRCKEEFMPTVAVVFVLFAVLLLGDDAA